MNATNQHVTEYKLGISKHLYISKVQLINKTLVPEFKQSRRLRKLIWKSWIADSNDTIKIIVVQTSLAEWVGQRANVTRLPAPWLLVLNAILLYYLKNCF